LFEGFLKFPARSVGLLDAPKQFVEVIEGLVGVLQALVVEDEAFDDVLLEPLRGPDAEAGGNGAFDAVANRNDGVQILEIGPVVLAVRGSSKEILYY